MEKKLILVCNTIFIAMLVLTSFTIRASAGSYLYSVSTGDKLPYSVSTGDKLPYSVSAGDKLPYSVSAGDKLPYNVSILKNGTNIAPALIWGLNLSQGDEFEVEVLDVTTLAGIDEFGRGIKIRFITDKEVGIKYDSAFNFIYASSKSYWQLAVNSNLTRHSHTTISLENDILSIAAYYNNGSDFVTTSFNVNDGILQTYERKTSKSYYFNYTYFKYDRIGEGPVNVTESFETTTTTLPENIDTTSENLAGFELYLTIFGLFIVIIQTKNRRKKLK